MQLSSFQETIYLVNKNFTDADYKEVTIKIVKVNGAIQFEYTISKDIIDKVKDIYPDKYKTQSPILRASTFEQLKDIISDISIDITFNETHKDKYGNKMLFIRFSGQNDVIRDGWCGGGKGNEIKLLFNFFVGYKLVSDKPTLGGGSVPSIKYSSTYQKSKFSNQEYKMGEIVPLCHSVSELKVLESQYLIIEYDETIYNFLIEIENKFATLNTELNEFLGNLTKEKLVDLIANKNIQTLLK